MKLKILFYVRQAEEISLLDLRNKIFTTNKIARISIGYNFLHDLFDLYRNNYIKINNKKFNDSSAQKDSANIEDVLAMLDSTKRTLFGENQEQFDCKEDPKNIIVSLTDYFYTVQHAIGFSISDEMLLLKEQLHKKSILGEVNSLLKTNVFVMMPFDKYILPVYEDHIKKVCNEMGYSCERGDDISITSNIMNDIWSLINNADIIICDCTGKNPNVFYELGLAHAIGKNVICITQNTEDIPFDIKHIRYIKYEYNPRGMTKFEKTLGQYIASINKTSLLI